MAERDAAPRGDDATNEDAPAESVQQASAVAEPRASEEDDAQSNTQIEESEESKVTSLTQEQQQAKYKWYKCAADPSTYGPGQFYWTQTESGESSWTEPSEPYWIWNTETGAIDPVGLQYPSAASGGTAQASSATTPADYQGYNPKIHGNYDPNADYAKFHARAQLPDTSASAASLAPAQLADGDAAAAYASAMVLNRFSGATQTGDHGPERHSDAAKSARQMNAFFDVDAAANTHEGKSLRAERQAQKFSKQQIKEFNAKRAEKKHKKRMQQLLS